MIAVSDSDKETDSDNLKERQLLNTNTNHYTDLYFLAEKYRIESLQNKAIDRLPAVMSGNHYSSFGVKSIYENTIESSPLLKFAVEHVAYYEILMEKNPEVDDIAKFCELGGDFVKDLIMQLCGTGTKLVTAPTSGPSCAYHVHSDGKRCFTFGG